MWGEEVHTTVFEHRCSEAAVCVKTLMHASTYADADHRVVVYADGSCYKNGQKNAVAGVGVYWGHGNPQ